MGNGLITGRGGGSPACTTTTSLLDCITWNRSTASWISEHRQKSGMWVGGRKLRATHRPWMLTSSSFLVTLMLLRLQFFSHESKQRRWRCGGLVCFVLSCVCISRLRCAVWVAQQYLGPLHIRDWRPVTHPCIQRSLIGRKGRDRSSSLHNRRWRPKAKTIYHGWKVYMNFYMAHVHGLLNFALGSPPWGMLGANFDRQCQWYGLWMRIKGPHIYMLMALALCKVALRVGLY